MHGEFRAKSGTKGDHQNTVTYLPQGATLVMALDKQPHRVLQTAQGQALNKMFKISTNCLPCPKQKFLNTSLLSYIFCQHQSSASRQVFGKDLLLLRGHLRINKQRRLPRSKSLLFFSDREHLQMQKESLSLCI